MLPAASALRRWAGAVVPYARHTFAIRPEARCAPPALTRAARQAVRQACVKCAAGLPHG